MPRPYMLDLPTCRAEVIIPEVARAMSLINRYGGRGEFAISDATHCLALSQCVPTHLEKVALIHDVSEIWFGDVSSPVKATLPEYKESEDRFLAQLCSWFGVDPSLLEALHPYDVLIRDDEFRCAFPNYDRGHKPGLGIDFVEVEPIEAELHWLARYVELFA